MENITSIFKEKKLKLTPQRLAVYKYLMSTTIILLQKLYIKLFSLNTLL